MDLASQKRALRSDISGRGRHVTVERALAAGRAAARALAGAEEFDRASSVALFAALPDEPSTGPIFDLARGAGKSTLLPRCLDDGSLAFFRVAAWEDLRPGRYGLLEPKPGLQRVDVLGVDLALLPGVAFDRRGNRLGRGGGYYDRTFPAEDVGRVILFGLAFADQVIDRVPTGPRDRGMDAVVTEDGILRLPRHRSSTGNERDS